jgi:hypothetical protein
LPVFCPIPTSTYWPGPSGGPATSAGTSSAPNRGQVDTRSSLPGRLCTYFYVLQARGGPLGTGRRGRPSNRHGGLQGALSGLRPNVEDGSRNGSIHQTAGWRLEDTTGRWVERGRATPHGPARERVAHLLRNSTPCSRSTWSTVSTPEHPPRSQGAPGGSHSLASGLSRPAAISSLAGTSDPRSPPTERPGGSLPGIRPEQVAERQPTSTPGPFPGPRKRRPPPLAGIQGLSKTGLWLARTGEALLVAVHLRPVETSRPAVDFRSSWSGPQCSRF